MNSDFQIKHDMSNKNRFLIAFVIFLVFFLGYFYSSGLMEAAGAFNDFDILFEMDTPRAIEDIAIFREDHSRTRVHPLYVLMVNPVGSSLAHLVGDEVLAARILNSVLGALGVALAFVFFQRYGRKTFDAVILASLFGVTTSQFFISSIPDTISLGVVSLILLYTLFFTSLKEKRVRFLPWFLVGLFTLGVTTTNFVQAGILFFIASLNALDEKKWVSAVLQSLKYGFAVLSSAVVLALVQKAIYPTTALFFLPQSFTGELGYASPLIFEQPRMVISYLVRTFLLINIAAPAPRFFEIPGLANPGVTFAASNDYSLVGWIALALWVGLMLFSVGKILLQKKNLLFYVGLSACLAFNFLLHSFYGVTPTRIELFLYTGNLTFLVMTPLAEAYLPKWENIFRILLLVLVVLLAVNNFHAMQAIIHAMAG
jgi:hypothetical protein